jgi:uncharacterized damage-inducible protein DinB
MTSLTTLASDNARYLEQAARLLETLSDTRYADPAPLNLGSSVGAHLRHCLDHYDNFFEGIATGRIDYDARRRDRTIEIDRTAALDKLHLLVAALSALEDAGDRPLPVKMDCGDDTDENTWWSDSSVRRELQFLISHTVHHFAIIKMVLTAAGHPMGSDFGIAPSTLRYHQGASACAH